MVCPRCVDTVKDIFDNLNIETNSIVLGEVEINDKATEEQYERIQQKLEERGFELLQDHKSKLINRIKGGIIDYIHHKKDKDLEVNFSSFLADKLNHEYSYLSRLFSSVEGITIEKFILKQKVERIKEVLFYNEFTLTEIAFQMGYSSAAHLSAQFKRETGMTPSDFKQLQKPGHKPLDAI